MSAGPSGRLPVTQAMRFARVSAPNAPDHAMYGTRSGFRAPSHARSVGGSAGRASGAGASAAASASPSGEALGGIAREASVDRGAERGRQPGRGAHHARRLLPSPAARSSAGRFGASKGRRPLTAR